MMRSKLHRARVTQTELSYMGSITIDRALLSAADIYPFEKVQVVNLNNGARFETYAIEGQKGSGEICLNGPAARLAEVGDEVIIISYAWMEEERAKGHEPVVVFLDEQNRIKNK